MDGLEAERVTLRNTKIKTNKWKITWKILAATYHLLVLVITGYLLYLAQNFNTTDLHVSLCTIGCVLLMSEAIVVLAEKDSWSHLLSRRTKTHLHWIFQACGTICCVLGIVIMYNSKRRHFRSIHGIVGIASVATTTCLFVSGIPILFAYRLRRIIPPVIIKFLHNTFGIICFLLGIVAQCLGYKKRWLSSKSSEQIVVVMITCTGIITAFALLVASRSFYSHFSVIIKRYVMKN